MASELTRFRRDLISQPLMKLYGKLMPRMSDTERQAIEAGTTWFEAQLFAGKPDWKYLRRPPAAQAFACREGVHRMGRSKSCAPCSMIGDRVRAP